MNKLQEAFDILLPDKFINCGCAPEVVASQELEPSEFMFYQYLPIKMASEDRIALPERLWFLSPLVTLVQHDANLKGRYVYLTAKSMFVDARSIGNRRGWHIDGFQSGGDINYIWYDANPTEFAIQDFKNIPNDDALSMEAIERQVIPARIEQYPPNTLLKLDETVVHRATEHVEECFRTFIKITVSDHQFRGFGNSKNHSFKYDWQPKKRRPEARNLDHG